MLLRIIGDHSKYVEQNKNRRAFLSMMTKIRATQTLGAVLTTRGCHDQAYNIYKKLVAEALHNDMREHFSLDHQKILENAQFDAKEKSSAQEKAWLMRSSIDSVYDQCLLDYTDVPGAMPPNLHIMIKDTINAASANIATGKTKAGFDEYLMLLKQMKNNRKYKDLVSPAAQKLVNESLEIAESADDLDTKTSKVRESLDRVYNEIRLPDVYSTSSGRPQIGVKRKYRTMEQNKKELLVVDFRQKDGSLFPYNIQVLDDKVMGGNSESNAILDEENQYFRFNGTVSKTNRGGFASFRIIPTCKSELQKVLSNTKAVVLEVRNMDTKNNRYKFQMANESHLKSFNWQAEFVVEPDDDFHTVTLDIYSFWPTMFGHVLSSPGNVDFSKVDCLGVLLSHVTVDGKENPDFVEGTYSLAIRSIRFIKGDYE